MDNRGNITVTGSDTFGIGTSFPLEFFHNKTKNLNKFIPLI
jgi:hypothetical protein